MLTVISPASGYDLISLADAKSMLGVVGTAEDAAIGAFITRASDVIARHCNRVFPTETVAEQFRHHGGGHHHEIVLTRYPLVAVSSIVEDAITLGSGDYEIDLAKGFVARLMNDRPGCWSAGKVLVTYSAGYSSMPQALQQAALQLVKAYYIGADRDPLIRSESVTLISNASYFSGSTTEHLPPDVRDLLKQFRRLL